MILVLYTPWVACEQHMFVGRRGRLDRQVTCCLHLTQRWLLAAGAEVLKSPQGAHLELRCRLQVNQNLHPSEPFVLRLVTHVHLCAGVGAFQFFVLTVRRQAQQPLQRHVSFARVGSSTTAAPHSVDVVRSHPYPPMPQLAHKSSGPIAFAGMPALGPRSASSLGGLPWGSRAPAAVAEQAWPPMMLATGESKADWFAFGAGGTRRHKAGVQPGRLTPQRHCQCHAVVTHLLGQGRVRGSPFTVCGAGAPNVPSLI